MRPTTALRATLAVLIGLATLWPGFATAVDRALLVGVSDYPALPRRLWLRGPVNDVNRMREVLLARGFDAGSVRVLASRAGGVDEPTRANILAAMQRVSTQVQPGDRIVLFLAGHGSQQPQPAQRGNRPLEPDGLDEVFLPADVRQWDGSGARAAIPNALLDDEIGEWIDGLVDQGAQVWAVFDTCHAAGMARGGVGRWRAVASSELGVTAPKSAAASSRPQRRRTDGRTLVFAARTNELTAEEWLPRGAGFRAARIHGVFTFYLAAALERHRQGDSSALEMAIRESYQLERRDRPTPVFEGNVRQVWP